MGATGEDDWKEVWDARADALAKILGQGHDNVFHAPHPFALGGNADVMAFHHHLDGVVYVTAELTGKPDACYADYELMIHGFAFEGQVYRLLSAVAKAVTGSHCFGHFFFGLTEKGPSQFLYFAGESSGKLAMYQIDTRAGTLKLVKTMDVARRLSAKNEAMKQDRTSSP